jgi:hypothetical protein
MKLMADALAWFRKAVAGARVQNEREDLLDELADNDLFVGDLMWQRDIAEKRSREIRSRLRELDAIERRAAEQVEPSEPAEVKSVHELQARFANKHPELAEAFRLRRYDDFHKEYWAAEVRRRDEKEKVAP